MKTICFFYHGGNNAGDHYCNPGLYYDFDDYERMAGNILELRANEERGNIITDSILIFGGGGIIDVTSTMSRLYANLDSSNRCFHWSSGSNRLNPKEIDWKLNPDEIDVQDDILEHFVLVGRRDFGKERQYENHRYVPCVSCKLRPLTRRYTVKRKIGIVNHMFLKKINGLDYPTIDMNLTKHKIDAIIRFIAESEIILTSSYHGAYWGFLLNKKVVINGNWSTKFDTLKYQPAHLSNDLSSDIEKCVQPSTDYLHECMELNDQFYQTVMQSLAGDSVVNEKTTPQPPSPPS